jgi:hypothetical protein
VALSIYIYIYIYVCVCVCVCVCVRIRSSSERPDPWRQNGSTCSFLLLFLGNVFFFLLSFFLLPTYLPFILSFCCNIYLEGQEIHAQPAPAGIAISGMRVGQAIEVLSVSIVRVLVR